MCHLASPTQSRGRQSSAALSLCAVRRHMYLTMAKLKENQMSSGKGLSYKPSGSLGSSSELLPGRGAGVHL